MRIEINENTFGSFTSYTDNLTGFINDKDSILNSFKTVENSTYQLNGGMGNLQSAADDIHARIVKEEQAKNAAVEVLRQTESFRINAINADASVSKLVDNNKEEFYCTNPWMRPPKSEDEKGWLEKAGEYVAEKFKEAGEAIREGFENLKGALVAVWDSAVKFYQDHKKIIDTILIVVGAVAAIAAVVATGGLSLVPLLTSWGLSASAALFISEAIAVCAVVTTAGSAVMNVIDTWFEIDNPVFQAWKNGLSIASAVFNITYSIGSIYNAKHNFKTEDIRNYIRESRTGDPVQYGGRYHDVAAANRNMGYEVHECPAKSAAKIIDGENRYHTPSVRMDPADHARTASFGHTRESMEYVRTQRELIKSGNFSKAFEMDIKDLEQFGFKYAKGIQEMKKYLKIYMKTRGLK